MKTRRVAILLPYNNKLEILFQDRRKISKRGEEYGFFGGHIEKGEAPKQALAREIKEELNIDIKKLENLEFFKKFRFIIKKWNIIVENFVFLAKMPNLKNLKVDEGIAEIMKLEDSFNLKLVSGDKQILKEIYKYLK